MATIRNLSSGDVVPQMGFAPTQTQNGGWEATRDYYMTASTWEGIDIQNRFARGVPIGTADPDVDSLFSFLTIESKSASYEDSGTVLLSVKYTGSANGQYGGENGNQLDLSALPTYRLECRLQDSPFTDHPKFQELDDDEQFVLGKCMSGAANLTKSLGKAIWTDSDNNEFVADESGTTLEVVSTNGLNFAYWINQGVTTYLAPAFVWTETTEGNTPLSSSTISKLGLIDSPRGTPPEPGSGRDWMMTSASQNQRGDLYQTNLEWTLSRPDGWDDMIYTS